MGRTTLVLTPGSGFARHLPGLRASRAYVGSGVLALLLGDFLAASRRRGCYGSQPLHAVKLYSLKIVEGLNAVDQANHVRP